jgi:hypothetical protein
VERVGLIVVALCASCDIFHSTDFPTKCSDAGCSEGGNDAGVTPFTTDSTKALDYAKQTCAWLAACEGPLGENETGKCIANAILAYDQATNPNRQPKAAAREYWQCLFDKASTRSCASVWTCTPPSQRETCPPAPLVGCFPSQGARIDCRSPGEFAQRESCASSGQTCAAQNGNVNALCAGPQGQSCGGDSGIPSGCSGTTLSVCDDAGVDRGRDCSSVGAGACVTVFDAGACKPESTGTCTPSLTVTCDGGFASGCQAGIPESVNCKNISGGCAEGFYPPTDPPSSACVNLTPTCSDDTCSGTSVLACVRGRSVAVDCIALGLKGCTTIPTTPDGPRPACGKP